MKENNTNQVPHKEICSNALKHYEKLADNCHTWLSTIPQAINFYKKYKQAIEEAGEELPEAWIPCVEKGGISYAPRKAIDYEEEIQPIITKKNLRIKELEKQYEELFEGYKSKVKKHCDERKELEVENEKLNKHIENFAMKYARVKATKFSYSFDEDMLPRNAKLQQENKKLNQEIKRLKEVENG